MKKAILATAAVAAGVLGMTSAQAAHKAGHHGCVMAGGEATMVTVDLAKFMAEAALKNSIAAHGWTAKGPLKMKCDAPNGLPHCMARRRACG